MTISLFDIFSIGIGPSSSHTIGPMRAAQQFITELDFSKNLHLVDAIKIDLYGSLALTGKGHSTDIAVMLGLEGWLPEYLKPEYVEKRISEIKNSQKLHLNQKVSISFIESENLLFHFNKQLPFHPNALRFTAYKCSKKILSQKIFYSVAGGFIIEHSIALAEKSLKLEPSEQTQSLFHFETAADLLSLCDKHNFSIAEVMMESEKTWRSEDEIKEGVLKIWQVMQECIQRGCLKEGILPGGLNVKRRAPQIYRTLISEKFDDPFEIMDWVSMWALAVNEENAAGGRVVTAPTNGAAGVIPSVLHYYVKYIPRANEQGIITFFLTAAAIAILYKKGASISAAEMGCMGEIGVASSMAAAGLAAVMGATNRQIENAAEIAMEHHLGLTCDPIKGLVQIPCIERNAMGANKAINAARLAYLHGDGFHRVSLDHVIATMRQTGRDMMTIYKETSQGGLAVNVPEC